MKRLIAGATIACLSAIRMQAGGTVQLQASLFDAAGPVTLSQGQTANVCATNLGS